MLRICPAWQGCILFKEGRYEAALKRFTDAANILDDKRRVCRALFLVGEGARVPILARSLVPNTPGADALPQQPPPALRLTGSSTACPSLLPPALRLTGSSTACPTLLPPALRLTGSSTAPCLQASAVLQHRRLPLQAQAIRGRPQAHRGHHREGS